MALKQVQKGRKAGIAAGQPELKALIGTHSHSMVQCAENGEAELASCLEKLAADFKPVLEKVQSATAVMSMVGTPALEVVLPQEVVVCDEDQASLKELFLPICGE